MKRLVLNKFYWWISSDSSIWGTWSVHNCEWLDISNSKYIQLSKWWLQISINTRIDWQIIASLYETNLNYLELSKDWWLTYSSWTITPALWDWYNIWKITIWTWAVYWFLITSTNFTIWDYAPWTLSLWFLTPPPVPTVKSFNSKAPYIIYSDFIYIWNWNKITKVDMNSGSAVLSDVLEIDNDYIIVWISRVSDQFFLYASNGSNWRQYLWDWITNSTDRVITYIDKPIQNIANFWNIDYLIVWTSSRQQICIVNWYQLQSLIVTDDFIDANNRIYFDANLTNSIETIWNKILFWWNWWVFSFWNKTPWLPQALSKEFLYIWWSLTNIFYSESIWSIFAYMSWTVNWVLWNYRTSISLNNNYWTVFNNGVWFLELQPIFWDTFSNIKSLEKITNWIELETTKTFVNILIKDLMFATFYTYDLNSWLTIWDIYTHDSRIFTVLNIINDTTDSWYVIHCSYTWNELSWKPSWTFTKTSWAWPTTLYTNLIRHWYKLIWSFTDNTLNRFTCNYWLYFNKMQLAIEMWSFDSKKTPKLYDINLYYNEDSND